jgi:MFS family permease
MALVTGGLAAPVGRMVDRVHPRLLTTTGYVCGAVALWLISRAMTPESEVWHLLAPIALFGVGSAFLWAPLSTTATRNLPMASAGAGAGVYNTTRQVGAVLGSAAIAAVIASRLTVHLPRLAGSTDQLQTTGAAMPPQIAGPFAAAMAESMLLPAGTLLHGDLLGLSVPRPTPAGAPARRARTSSGRAHLTRLRP